MVRSPSATCQSKRRPGPSPARCAVAIAACALALLAAGNAAAALYKWTDANGRVVYSDQPPTGNVKYERVDGAPPPSNPNAVKEMAAREAEFNKRQTDATKADKKSKMPTASSRPRWSKCATAPRSNIRTLAAEQVALVRHNEKGEQVVVDDVTRRRERTEIEAWVKANCCNLSAPPSDMKTGAAGARFHGGSASTR